MWHSATYGSTLKRRSDISASSNRRPVSGVIIAGHMRMVEFLKEEVVGTLDQFTYFFNAGFVYKGLDTGGSELVGQGSVQQQIDALFDLFRVEFIFGNGWIVLKIGFDIHGHVVDQMLVT